MTAAQTAKKASTTWDDWYGIDADPRRRRVIWGATLLASVLLHLILLKTSSVSWWSPIHPPRMEVQEMDTAALERIKRQWTQEPEQFVLGNSKPSVTAANPTARFASDRNRKVEREQRARQTAVLPNSVRTRGSPAKGLKTTGPLSHLGVPIRYEPKVDGQNGEKSIAQAETGDQSLNRDDLAVGDENLLNTRESVYYSFYSRVYEQIAPNWSSRIREASMRVQVPPGDYISLVDVTLDASGNLIDIQFIQRSGVREFDQAVVESWKKIARFPNPPAGLLDPQKQVHLRWSYRVDAGSGSGLRSAPPRRVPRSAEN